MLNTQLAELLGIKYPIMQGGMAHISTGKMAAAVSNAGALGIIATASKDVDFVKEQIKEAKKLTDKPFGVNVMLANPHSPKIMELVINEQIEVVTTGAGSPAKYMDGLLKANCKVIPVIPHVKAAKKVESLGALAVVAEGRESGGHIGPVSTFCLVPQVVDAVKIPVIAAGGIADGRGYCAAAMFGAIGVQMGSLFMLAEECPISNDYKQRIIEADDNSTCVTGIGTKDEVRAIKNELTDRYFDLLKQPADTEAERMNLIIGSLNRAVNGDMIDGSIQVGQICGMLKQVMPVKELLELFMEDVYKTYEAFRK